jgi:hypothetical protein
MVLYCYKSMVLYLYKFIVLICNPMIYHALFAQLAGGVCS